MLGSDGVFISIATTFSSVVLGCQMCFKDVDCGVLT